VSSKEVRAQFEPVARNYVTSHFHADAKRLTELVDLVEPAPGDVVLDAATGTGNAGLALAPHVAWVIGLDLTPAMLDQAARSAREAGLRNVTWVIGDATALPFPAESFDVYACRAAPHHFADVRAALAEAWKVLRPGGRAALIDCSPPPEIRDFMHSIEVARDPTHVLSLTVEEWIALLAETGFEVECAERRELSWRFEDWMGTMAVPEERARELAAAIESAPPLVREQLAPSRRDGELWHSYWHALIRARKPG
jgi:ubiquinone/menaquinone biosynthesis C-methylase UbiE